MENTKLNELREILNENRKEYRKFKEDYDKNSLPNDNDRNNLASILKILNKTIQLYNEEKARIKKEKVLAIKTNDNLFNKYDNKDLFILYDVDHKITLVGIKENNKIKLGYSICSKKEPFNKKIGREIALKRAEKGLWTIPTILNDPAKIRKYLFDIIDENKYNTNELKPVIKAFNN